MVEIPETKRTFKNHAMIRANLVHVLGARGGALRGGGCLRVEDKASVDREAHSRSRSTIDAIELATQCSWFLCGTKGTLSAAPRRVGWPIVMAR